MYELDVAPCSIGGSIVDLYYVVTVRVYLRIEEIFGFERMGQGSAAVSI